jgi:hypothetical protein
LKDELHLPHGQRVIQTSAAGLSISINAPHDGHFWSVGTPAWNCKYAFITGRWSGVSLSDANSRSIASVVARAECCITTCLIDQQRKLASGAGGRCYLL